MAQRWLDQFQGTLEKGMITVYGVINVGAAGALTLQQWSPPTLSNAQVGSYSAASTSAATPFTTANKGARGIASVTRTSAGCWQIKLQDSYVRLLQVNPTFVNACGATGTTTPAAPFVFVNTSAVSGQATNVALQGGGVINLVLASAVNTPADPASGEQIILEIQLQNSTAL